MLSNEDQERVCEIWNALMPVADKTAVHFYEWLAENDPHCAAFFAHLDDAARQRHVVDILDLVVANLQVPDAMYPDLQALGLRHAGQGIRASDYDAIERALVWSMSHMLGPRFTPAAEFAWSSAYRLAANAMQSRSLRIIAA